MWLPGARLGDRELEAEFGRELVLWLLLFLLLAFSDKISASLRCEKESRPGSEGRLASKRGGREAASPGVGVVGVLAGVELTLLSPTCCFLLL